MLQRRVSEQTGRFNTRLAHSIACLAAGRPSRDPSLPSSGTITTGVLPNFASCRETDPRKTLGFTTPAEKLTELIDGLEQAGRMRMVTGGAVTG